MKIQLMNDATTNNILEFQVPYLIQIDDFELAQKSKDVYGSSKKNIIGLPTSKNRGIKITLQIASEDDTYFRDLINSLYSFHYNRRVWLQDIDNNIECEVFLNKIDKFLEEGTELRFAKLVLTYSMIDTLFKDINYTETTININNGFSVNSPTITINNIDTYSKIEIKCTNTSFQSVKIYGPQNYLLIDTSGYIQNDLLVIDGYEGQIYYEKSNGTKIFVENQVAEGSFILLQKGNNTLSFIFNAQGIYDIKIKHKEFYII